MDFIMNWRDSKLFVFGSTILGTTTILGGILYSMILPTWDKAHEADKSSLISETASLKTEIKTLEGKKKDYDSLLSNYGKLSTEHQALELQVESDRLEDEREAQQIPKDPSVIPVKNVQFKIVQIAQQHIATVNKMELQAKAIYAMLTTGVQLEHREKMSGLKISQTAIDTSAAIHNNYYFAKENITSLVTNTSLAVGIQYQTFLSKNLTMPTNEFMQKIREPQEAFVKFKEQLDQLEKDLRTIPPSEWCIKAKEPITIEYF